ncbi:MULTISPECIES: hypothetical protein [Pseudophaeobacter]|uniref:hypothetical protein n=1 Tax=Pseudophaeobacter TaxID=1541822 RepID=UPI002431E17F|nr:hypothetical protein [Pseudophaeobacter profundi]
MAADPNVKPKMETVPSKCCASRILPITCPFASLVFEPMLAVGAGAVFLHFQWKIKFPLEPDSKGDKNSQHK